MHPLRPSPELEAIAARWLRAYGDGDIDTVTNLFSEDPALSYMGSDDNELWRDDVLRRGMASYIELIPRFRVSIRESRSSLRDGLGWVELLLDAALPDIGQGVPFRFTMIFQLERGLWKIVHLHSSTPVPNVHALGYDSAGFEDLLEAALATPESYAGTGIATIMFTDIADSTTIAETIGDARWSQAVKRHVAQLEEVIADHGGTLVKSLGDGTMSSFPSARAGLGAAIALQRAMARSDGEPRLQIRIGLHTGDLVEQDGDMFGTVVNKAARIAAIAAPGEIRLSDATRIMVGGGDFAFADSVTIPLRGLDGEHVLYRLEWQA